VKIALFTPWPPQKSGIADYAYSLANGLLAHGLSVEVYTGAATPAALPNCKVHSCNGTGPAPDLSDAFPVFQLGNNFTYHAFQPRLLARLGGLVHLHDPVLHHLHVDRTLAAGGVGGYWEDLRFWYGPDVAADCQRLRTLGAPPWTNAAVTAVPLFEPYLQFADAVLVHSQGAARRIGERMPDLPIYRLPQCYPISPSIRPRVIGDRPLKLGVFGWIEPYKRLDRVLAAMATLRDRGQEMELELCGPTGATMTALAADIAALGLGGSVHVRGHLERSAFLAAIAAVDVCINLRDPSMGETSAVVTQAMQLGTPVIVTDTGWYAELPECVLKVPSGESASAALVALLARLDANRDEIGALAEATRSYASSHLDFETMIGDYAGILGRLAATWAQQRKVQRSLYLGVASALADLALTGSTIEQAMQAEILRMLTPCL